MKIGNAEFKRGKMRRYSGMLLVHPFLFLVRFASYLMPRSKKVWVFGQPTKFEGNSKYFFLYAQNERRSEITSLWISHNKRLIEELKKYGYDAAHVRSPRAMWYILRARYFIVDTSVEAIHYWLSGGGHVIL